MKHTPTRTATVLNILGLAVAIAAFLIVAMVRYYDLRYDKSYPGADRIYELKSWRGMANSDQKWSILQNSAGFRILTGITPENLANPQAKLPFEGLEDVCILRGYGYGEFRMYAQDTPETDTLLPVQVATPSIFPFFGIKIKTGSLENFGDYHNVVITSSLSDYLFPNGDAVGRKMVITTAPDEQYADLKGVGIVDTVTVIAVYKDFPQNTSMAYYGVIRCFKLDEIEVEGGERCYKLDDIRGHIYYKLKERCQIEEFVQKVFAQYQNEYQSYMSTMDTTGDSELCYTERAQKYENAPKECDSLSLELLSEQEPYWHWYYGFDEEHTTVVSKMLGVFGIVLLLLAFLNYTNYAAATVPLYLHKTNIRKIEGCSNGQLRWEMFGRFLLGAFVAFVVALVIVEICARTKVIPFVDISLQLADNLPAVWITAAVTFAVALIASLYPVFYSTDAGNIDAALKKSLSDPTKSGWWRKLLLRLQTTPSSVLQFYATFAITLFLLLVLVQNHSIKTADLGFNTENVYVSVGKLYNTDFADDEGEVNIDLYRLQDKLDSISGVQEVTFAMDPVLGWGEVVSRQGMLLDGNQITLVSRVVSPNFFDFFDIEVVKGRELKRPFGSIPVESVVNESALKENEALYSDSSLSLLRVVGVVRDYHNLSLVDEIEPCKYYPWSSHLARGLRDCYFYVKLKEGQDASQVEDEMKRKMNLDGFDGFKFGPLQSLKPEIDKEYHNEDDFAKLMVLFGAVTLFVTLTGLLGMVMLDCTYRCRELSLRRVYGASNENLLWMVVRNILITCVLCFVCAAPLAVSIFHKWQQHFAYKADIPVWPFLATFLVITLLALGITAWQTLRTLREEPDI